MGEREGLSSEGWREGGRVCGRKGRGRKREMNGSVMT